MKFMDFVTHLPIKVCGEKNEIIIKPGKWL